MKISGGRLMVGRSLFQEGDGGSMPTSPLQLEIKEISPQLAEFMNNRWHSRLPKINWSNITRNTHYVCYGFYFGSYCYGVAIWSSPVAQNRFNDGKTILELRRMAISDDAPKNTASRTLGIMVKLIKKKFPDIKRLISYQDTEVHKGTIYKASGWQPINKTKYISWLGIKPKATLASQSMADKIRWEKLL